MRQITVSIEGKEYTFPANMNVLRRAEKLSGITTAVALTPGTEDFGSAGFVLGVVAAGIERSGERFKAGTDTEFITAVGDRISFEESDALYEAVYTALKPELVEKSLPESKTEAGESEDPPAGRSGSA